MFLINRDLAMTVLANEPLGSFMVRKSETQPGTLALSVRVPKTFHPLGITHYIIIRVETGYQIKVRNSQHGVRASQQEQLMSNLFPTACTIVCKVNLYILFLQ